MEDLQRHRSHRGHIVQGVEVAAEVFLEEDLVAEEADRGKIVT